MTQNKESGCLLYQKISVKGDQHGPFFPTDKPNNNKVFTQNCIRKKLSFSRALWRKKRSKYNNEGRQIKVEMGTYRQDFGPPTFVIVNTHLPSVCLEVGPSFLYLGAH